MLLPKDFDDPRGLEFTADKGIISAFSPHQDTYGGTQSEAKLLSLPSEVESVTPQDFRAREKKGSQESSKTSAAFSGECVPFS